MTYCVGVRKKGEKDYFVLDHTLSENMKQLYGHLEETLCMFKESKPGALQISVMEESPKKGFQPVSIASLQENLKNIPALSDAVWDSYMDGKVSKEEYEHLNQSLSVEEENKYLRKIKVSLQLFEASPKMVASTILMGSKLSRQNTDARMRDVYDLLEEAYRRSCDVPRSGTSDQIKNIRGNPKPKSPDRILPPAKDPSARSSDHPPKKPPNPNRKKPDER